MSTVTIKSISGLDFHVFSDDELLSLRKEIDEELKQRKENKSSGRLPIDLFAQKARRDVCCPTCGCHRYSEDGVRSGRKRLLCQECGTRFGYLSGTMLGNSKLSLMRLTQLATYIVLDFPVWTMSYLSGMDEKTVQLWRYRICDIASEYLEKAVLSGKIWIDETYWRITDQGLISVEKDGKLPRGLSGNLVCVLVAYDIHHSYYCKVMDKRGNPGAEEIYGSLHERIRPGSTIIHDGARSHRLLIESLRLKEKVVKSTSTDKKEREQMEPIDNVCSLLKFEVGKHRGIHTNHLKELLPWFAFKAMKMSKYGIDEVVEQILTKLFDAEKTEGYYERFNTKRKIRKKRSKTDESITQVHH